MRKGEQFNLQGPDDKRFVVEVLNAGKKDVVIKVLKQIPTPPEPEINITLLQAMVNEKALDFILQKSTELGAREIVLFNSANVAAKLSIDQFNKKKDRWGRILWEAAKQCDRVRPPKLEFVDNVQPVLSEYQKVVLLDPAGGKLKDLKIERLKDCAILIGPEGGFTEEEVDKFKSLSNCVPVSLGPILLRAETAALAGLAVLQNLAV
jgi:16S rRNA (uracil1498-N3)-methyltransferase